MPPWFIDIESATEIEAKSNGTPPAPRMAAQAWRANSPSSALHGVTRPSVEATPTNGLPRSASDRPSARRNARWGARSSPSTVMREGSFGILMFRGHSKRQRQGGKMLRAVLAPISGVNYSDLLMVIHPSVPASNLKEFIELAKSKPGALNYASSGPGTPYHMAGELFKAMAGVDIVHVPHKGSDQARTAILGKQVDMMFDAITTMAANARAGRVKALASSGKARSPVTPDVPTLAEAGVPGYEATIWLGLMAPAGTPRPILEKLNVEVNKVVNAPEVKEAWSKQGAVPMSMSVDQFDRFLREDIDKWAKLVKLSGAKVD